MKRYLFLVVLGLLSAGAVLAAPHVYSDSEFKAAHEAVANALPMLTVNDSEWSIFIISDTDWRSALRTGQRGHTAYTLPGKKTYLNAQWIKDIHGNSAAIAKILAHEYGHILCSCTDEGTAESYVSTLFHSR